MNRSVPPLAVDSHGSPSTSPVLRLARMTGYRRGRSGMDEFVLERTFEGLPGDMDLSAPRLCDIGVAGTDQPLLDLG